MTLQRLPIGLIASLGLTLSCGQHWSSGKGNAKDTGVSNLGSGAHFLSRKVTVSDLYIPYPVVDSLAVTSEESGRLSLADLVGNENAAAVVRHIALKSNVGELDKEEAAEAARFWNVNPSAPGFSPLRHEPAFRECIENPKNLTVRAIRFAPFETPLPGALLDWKSAFPNANLEHGVQLRFVLQAHCDFDDASAHVIFNLEPKALRAKFSKLELDVNDAAESRNPEAALALSRDLDTLYSSGPYMNWRSQILETWLSTTAGLRRDADSASLARLESLPQNLLAQASKLGFATVLRDLIFAALGIKPSPRDQAPDFSISTLKDSKSKSALEFHETLRNLLKEEARLVKVTTFSTTGFETWSFGELKTDINGKLAPAVIGTTDTVREGGPSGRLRIQVTSRLGLYENASELNETGQASKVFTDIDDRIDFIFAPRVPSKTTFSRVNAVPTRGGLIHFTGEKRGARASVDNASFIETVTDVKRVNASNMTCATCHLTNQGSSLAPGANLHMLTDLSGKNMNLRTAAEVLNELKGLNATTKK